MTDCCRKEVWGLYCPELWVLSYMSCHYTHKCVHVPVSVCVPVYMHLCVCMCVSLMSACVHVSVHACEWYVRVYKPHLGFSGADRQPLGRQGWLTHFQR
jgi:hypothetical protein